MAADEPTLESDPTEYYRRLAIQYAGYQAAIEDTGTYPAKVTGGPHPYEQRTDKMEGHNEAVSGLTDKALVAWNFLEHLPKEISQLYFEEGLIISFDKLPDVEVGKRRMFDYTAHVHVNCNDLFYWGCGDAETLTPEDYPALLEALKESPKNGALLWCCRHRGMRPQWPYYKSFDKETEWPLFNAAGPERDDPDGKHRE